MIGLRKGSVWASCGLRMGFTGPLRGLGSGFTVALWGLFGGFAVTLQWICSCLAGAWQGLNRVFVIVGVKGALEQLSASFATPSPGGFVLIVVPLRWP